MRDALALLRSNTTFFAALRIGELAAMAAISSQILLAAGITYTTVGPGFVDLSSNSFAYASQVTPGENLLTVDAYVNPPYASYWQFLTQAGPISSASPGGCGDLGTTGGPALAVIGSGVAAACAAAVVDPASGALRAAVGASTAPGQGYSAFGDAGAAFGDTITLSQAATVTLSGSLEGYNLGWNSAVEIDMYFAFFDPASFQTCLPNTDGAYPCANAYGGIYTRYAATYPDATGIMAESGPEPQYPFSLPVNLPAGNSTLLAGLALYSTSACSVCDLTSSGAAALDFSHTLQFGLSAPSGVTITSLDGIPVGGSAVPEPSSFLLSAPVLALICMRRRHP